ncbi:MAG: hypothetical protein AB7S92_19680 [Parvibaculaceae bacterium]
MTDDAGAAAAAAEPSTLDAGAGAAAADAAGEARAEPSARSSIERAFAEIEKREQDAAGGTAARPGSGAEADGGAPSGEPGDAPAAPEAPQRFSADARAAWPSVPDEVKGEVHRTFRELESGLTRYQQAFEPLKLFYRLAEQNDTTVPEALSRYTALDIQLASGDPKDRLLAIEEVLAYAGMSPADYAAHVAAAPAQQAKRPDAGEAPAGEVESLRRDLAALKAAMGGVTGTLEASRQAEVTRMVADFARSHPRLDDRRFTDTVIRLITTRMADDLAGAYDMAQRLIPAAGAGTPSPAASDAAAAPAAQTRKGGISIAGAPVSGSNPAKRRPAPSARESLDRAFAELGL